MSEDTSSEKEDDVVARAEAELRSQRLDEPDWNAMAERVLSALPQAGAIEAALLEAPLPAQEDESALDRASSTRTKGAEPSVEFGSREATLDDAWADLPAGETTSEEPAFTAVASMPYVATETAVTESGIVETAAARNGRGERSGERELVSLDELIPERGRERNEILPPSKEAAAELTAKSGEHGAKEAETESRREAVSLADLARSSVSRRSQDVASIAKESIAVARTHTGVARRVQAADAAANLPSVMIAPSAADPPTEPPVRAPSNQGPIIGAAIAIVGLAAGFAFYIAGQRSTDPLVVTQVAPAPAPALDQAPAPANPEANAPAAAAEPSPASLTPPTGTEEATAPAPAVAGAARPMGAGAALPSSRVAPEKIVLNEDEPGVRPEKVVLDEEPSTPGASKGPPPSDSPPLKPAELSHGSGGLPDRPSSGAVQAAVGSVLGAARSCLAGQLEPSNARVLFVSDGSVQSVQISGPAAGTPAASCIESAFKKARVQPFAAPSFSFGTKVRPP